MYKKILIFVFISISAFAKEPLRVAVLDSGLDLKDERFQSVLCKEGHKDFTGTGIEDTNGHGTHIAGLIKQYAKDASYCLVIVKYFDDKLTTSKERTDAYKNSLDYLAKNPPDLLNVSGGGKEGMESEYLFFKNIAYTAFVAIGNDNTDLNKSCNYYPACYKKYESLPYIHAVGSECNHIKSSFSNYGEFITDWECGEAVLSTAIKGMDRMSGTSQATAIATGKYLYKYK
jgi:hypothetical protein